MIDDIRKIKTFESFLESPSSDDLWQAMTSCAPIAYASCSEFGSVLLLVAADDAGKINVEVVAQATLTASALVELLAEPAGTLHPSSSSGDAVDPTSVMLARVAPVIGSAFGAPLAARLRRSGHRSVALVACGSLSATPWAAAVYDAADGSGPLRLIDEVTVSYAPSARVLDTRKALVLASATRPLSFLGLGDSTPQSSPLPMSRVEVRTIARAFPASDVLIGEDATSELAVQSVGGATHVHFAIHSMYSWTDPLRSHLATQTGELTIEDLMNRRLFSDVRLVVASSCESAVTSIHLGSDEYLGLSTGFIWAGAAASVGTLWPVADTPTALLMCEFYRHYLGPGGAGDRSGPEALRLAQLWLAQSSLADIHRQLADLHARMIQMDGPDESVSRAVQEELAADLDAAPNSTPYADPVHWAAFVYVGV